MGLVGSVAKDAGICIYGEDPIELISTNDMPKFLEAIRKNSDYLILGLEGFKIFKDKIVPDMDAIADFSALLASDDSATTVQAAYKFLSAVMNKDLFFYLTLHPRHI